MKPRRPAYAIVRIDPDSYGELQNRVSVVKVLLDWDAAEKEANRLNELNGSKGSRYFAQITRIYENEL